MDKVTHFLFLTALILVIMCCIMWVLTASCTAGFFSTHKKIPDWVRDGATNAAGNIRDTVREISDMADDVRRGYRERKLEERLRM